TDIPDQTLNNTHDRFYDTFLTKRGNLNAMTVGLAPDPLATSYRYYDIAGNIVQTKDPASHTASAPFNTSTNYIFPSQVTNMLSQSVAFSFAPNTTLTYVQDPNTQQINFLYDPQTRPTQVNRPDGGQTSYTYDDVSVPIRVTETTKIDDTQNLLTATDY